MYVNIVAWKEAFLKMDIIYLQKLGGIWKAAKKIFKECNGNPLDIPALKQSEKNKDRKILLVYYPVN